MNRTAKEMTTLPLTLLQELVKEAAADLATKPRVYPYDVRCGYSQKTYHRNHVKRKLDVEVWNSGQVRASFSFTDKRTGSSVVRSQVVRGHRMDLLVGRLGESGLKPNWKGIHNLEDDMAWGYYLAMSGKLKHK